MVICSDSVIYSTSKQAKLKLKTLFIAWFIARLSAGLVNRLNKD